MYAYRCANCGTFQDVFKKISELDLPEECSLCNEVMVRQIVAPMVQPDYAGYTCPITGDWIEGRRAHQENLKKHGCRLLEKGEREHNERMREAEDTKLMDTLVETFASEVQRLPARKREILAGELEAGADLPLVRKSA